MKSIFCLFLGVALIATINAAAVPTIEETKPSFEIVEEEKEQIEVPEEFIDEIEEEINSYLDNLEDDDDVPQEMEHNVVKRSPHSYYRKPSYRRSYGKSYVRRPYYGHHRRSHHGSRRGLRKLIKGIVVASIIKGAILG